MEMNQKTIKALLDAFEQSDWQEMTVTFGSDRLHVSRDAQSNGARPDVEVSPPAPVVPAPVAPATSAPVAEGTVIAAPSVGLFWRAPSPTSPPFVEVGSRVAAGDMVAIVEVMKLMSHVVSPVAGVVVGIHVENGAMVEFGQPLIVVDPEG